MQTPVFYTESGEFDRAKYLIGLLVVITAGLLLGYLYTVINIFIPIVYLNVVTVFGFGLAMGLATRLVGRFLKNRNRRSRLALGLVAGIAANYFQWIGYVDYVLIGEIPSFGLYVANLDWIFRPAEFFGVIGEINRVGTWEVFGIEFKGFMLTVIWIFELAIIGYLPVASILNIDVFPYSETQHQWYKKFTLNDDFTAVSSASAIQDSLLTDPVQAIRDLGNGQGWRHSKVHLFFLEEESDQYLSIERIFIEEQGRGKKQRTPIVTNMRIPKEAAHQILNTFDHSRERIEVF